MTIPDGLARALAERYRIERELGAGGMATVYLAEDLKHSRRVAIKVLRPELAAVIGAERFLAEIRTTANLQHPHILPLHDSGEAGGSVFYVMTYIEGESLRARLERERQLPIADAVQLVLDVAGALDYAHRHGVVHRDIKPENILLHDGRAVVADFGIALAATSAGSRMTETGMSLGTPTYMSPEQAMGERTLDGRTDVYALGCVLYELLVGAPPFVGPTAQAIVAKVLTERPTPPSTARDTVPAALDAVILTALSKLPADRQPSAAAFAEALREAQRAPTVAATAGTPALGMPTTGRSQSIGGWHGLAVGAALGALVVWGIANFREGREPVATREQRVQLTFDGIARRPAISADGRFVAYVMSACPGGPEIPCQTSLQVQEIGGSRPITLVENALEIGRPRWTHDGSQLVYPARLDAERSGVYAVPRLGGDARLVTTRFGELDVHPSADSLAIAQGGWVVVLDLALGRVRDSIAVPLGSRRGIAWSPDGRRFAIADNYAQVRVIGRDGRSADTLSLPLRPDIAWSPDGRSVLVFIVREGVADDLAHLPVDAKGRLARRPYILLAKETTAMHGEFDVARQTGRIVILSGSILIDYWRVPLERPAAAQRLTQGTAWYGSPSLTADGRTVYYMRGDAIGDNVYAIGPDGRERALTREPHPGGDMGISWDDRRIIFTHTLPTGTRAGEMRLPAGDISYQSYQQGSVAAGPEPVGVRRVAWLSRSTTSVVFIDSIGGAEREVSLGEGRSGMYAVGGRSERDVFVSATRDVEGTTRHEVLRVPLDGAAITVMATLPGPALTLDARTDGSVWISRWAAGDAGVSLWEIPAAGGAPVRRAALPTVCTPGRMAVAGAAPVAVCSAAVRRADVWVVDGVSP